MDGGNCVDGQKAGQEHTVAYGGSRSHFAIVRAKSIGNEKIAGTTEGFDGD